ncbi:conserved hypothetical protein [Sporisorium reilianum SRZ2]|uniref:Uncharacterized protein n=1 Tax=Sporisorium reilianum (strain SRZ2) TaxID=999809 RepID=E6ZL39_SPORE|nr:conserved hypothetical protein [Sporisorium reilianum SRZ2]
MRLIRRPDRQRPWWLAVGVLAFVLLFTIVSAAPTVPEASGSTSEIQPASDGKPPRFNRAPSFDRFSSLESSQIPASGRLDTRPPSRDLTFPTLEGPAANEVPVNYRSQEMGPMAKQMYGGGNFAVVAKWRQFMRRVRAIYPEKQEKLRQKKEQRIAALRAQRGEVEVYPHYQLTHEELAAARKASVIAEADERHRAATRANEAAALRRASTQETGAAARVALDPTSNFEASPRSHRPAPFASMEGTSRTARSAGYVQLSRDPSSSWDAKMMLRQAATRVEGANVRINDALRQMPLPEVPLSELGHLRLRKRSGASASTPPDPNVPARDQGEGSVVVSAIPGQAGIHEPSRLLKRMWPFRKNKYKQLGSSSAGSSSEAHATTAAPLEALDQFYYPGQKIVITNDGRGHSNFNFMMLTEAGDSHQSYQWSQLPANIKAALTKRITNLEHAVQHGVTKSEAKELGIPIASFPNYASDAIQHPLYPQQFIDIARNGRGEIVFKRPDGQYVKFSELDNNVKAYMERSSPRSAYVDEAIRTAQRAPRVRKRAVDTLDDKVGQVQRRAAPSTSSYLDRGTDLVEPSRGVASSDGVSTSFSDQAGKWEHTRLQRRGGGSSSTARSLGAGSSSGDSSRIELPTASSYVQYPGRKITITREDHNPPFKVNILKEDGSGIMEAHWWPNLPDELKKALTKQVENLQKVLDSGVPAEEARRQGIKIAESYRDTSDPYDHPLFPAQRYKITAKGSKIKFEAGGKKFEFQKLPNHVQRFIRSAKDALGLASEAADKAEGEELARIRRRLPRKYRKRAVDTDDDDHQARKRELSVLHKRGDPPGTGSSAAGSSRQTASLQPGMRIFPYPGQTMTITRADGPGEPYEFHFFRENADAPHLSRSWSELPEDFKKVVRQRREFGFVPVAAESRMPPHDARRVGIKVASRPYDPNNAYFHPSYPSENIQISRDGQGQVMFRSGRGAVAFSQLPPHLRSYMQGRPNPHLLLKEAIESSHPVPSVTYPGERILVTQGHDGSFVHYIARAQGRDWSHQTERLSSLPHVQAMLDEDRIKVASNVLDTDNAVFNPERSPEQIHIRNINGELEFQRQTPFLTHEFVKLGELPDHLRHYLTTSEEAQRVMREARSSLPHVRKRAIPAGEETLLARAGGGSIPTVTLGKGGSSGSPSDVDAPQRNILRWFKSLGSSPSTIPGYGVRTSRELKYPGQGIRFSMTARRANFWPFNGFEGDNVMLMPFGSLKPEEQRLVQESSPNFQDVLSGKVEDVQWTKAVDGFDYLTYYWPDKGPEKLVETTRDNGVFYSRQSLDGKPIGDKAFYQLSELPKHLQDFIK